jgi:DNA repair exonuclease SbcCD ATPase subunit
MSDSESSAAWVSWQAYTDARLTALEKQADAVERSRELRLAAECKALDARFAAMDKALAIATGEAEKRWSASNEFRSSLDDAVQTLKSVTTLLPSRAEFDSLRERVNSTLVTVPQHEALVDRIDGIESWKDKQEGKATQTSVLWTAGLAGAAFIMGLITFIIERFTP